MTSEPDGLGQVVDVLPTTSQFDAIQKSMLVKSDALKAIRIMLPAGHLLPDHKAPGSITVHCLVGKLQFNCRGDAHSLGPHQLISLPPGEMHSVQAMEDSVLLLTILNSGV